MSPWHSVLCMKVSSMHFQALLYNRQMLMSWHSVLCLKESSMCFQALSYDRQTLMSPWHSVLCLKESSMRSVIQQTDVYDTSPQCLVSVRNLACTFRLCHMTDRCWCHLRHSVLYLLGIWHALSDFVIRQTDVDVTMARLVSDWNLASAFRLCHTTDRCWCHLGTVSCVC